MDIEKSETIIVSDVDEIYIYIDDEVHKKFGLEQLKDQDVHVELHGSNK